jgi:hypothetical protein
MSGLRILVLRATRLVRRAPVRSLTTGLLVMAAVLAGSLWVAASLGHHEAEMSVESQLGRADARYGLFPWGPESDEDGPGVPVPVSEQVDAVLAALPPGSRTAVLERFDTLGLGNWTISDPLVITQGPWDDPMLSGMVDLADGRVPGPGEVVVPPELAAATGLDLGDELVTLDPPAALEVVGLGSISGPPGLLVAPGEFVAASPSSTATAPQGSASVLVTLPPGMDPPQLPVVDIDGSAQVAYPFTRDDLIDNAPSRTPAVIISLVITFVGLSAGSAFAIGAARRRRALGLLAANGATPAQLRMAAGAEALVVSVPAVALGVAAAVAAPVVWVRLQLPGWDRIWQVDVSPGWTALLAGAAVVAAVLGTLAFSGSAARTSVPSLLDQRGPARRAATTRPRWGVVAVVLAVVAALFALPFIGLVAARGPAIGAVVGVVLLVLVWCAGAAGVVVSARWVLSRNPVGRLVGRDLVRRPMGTGAAVMVVTVWCFAAVAWALTAGIGGADEAAATEGSSASATSEGAVEAGPGTITIQPAPTAPLRHRSAITDGERSGVSEQLRDRLAELGLATRSATVGVFTGACPVCPGDYRPTVMVLDSVEGLDLPAETEAALLAGSAVTAFDLDGVDGATIGGLPVTVAPLPLGANAAMLAEFAPEGGTALAEPTRVLVGSTEGLSDEAAAEVVAELADAGLIASSQDLRVQPITTAEANGLGLVEPVDRDPWWWGLSVVVLALVTMAATVAHRREHGEAAHVLWVLGAGPRAGRRLASLTAGTIAAVGTLLGATTAIAVVAMTWLSRDDLYRDDVLEPRRVLTVLAVVVVVPAAAAALGRLLPAPRSVRVDLRPA